MSEPEPESRSSEPEQGPSEPVSQLVSSSSAQPEAANSEATSEIPDGCDSTTEVNETDDILPEGPPEDITNESCSEDTEEAKGKSDEDDKLSNAESDTSSKTSRELKSILALSKEAKLDTNLSNRRKTLESKQKEEASPSAKKVINIKLSSGFPVTAESELENFEAGASTKGGDENSKNRKRKSSLDGAAEHDSCRRRSLDVGDFVMSKKPNKDIFCWRCHHDSVQIACETCPRAYHLKCLKQNIADMEHWPCPECVAILKAENTQTRSKAMKSMTLEHLCSLLKYAVKRMIQCNGSEPFLHPVDEKQFPEYRNYIVQPMTLTMLQNNIRNNLYGSTQAFEADAKWILHNSIIFNSSFADQSKLTTAAKSIVKICKQEMAEIENCASCYLNANTKKHTWFVEVCPKPHLLVWAKLKGFPYWPAKVMSISAAGMADVRFFGAHDKAWVSVKDCFLYSVKDPNSGKQKRNDIAECVKELELYVENLRRIYGRVHYAPFKTPLDADNQMKQLQLFLPTFRGEGKEVKKIDYNKDDSVGQNNEKTTLPDNDDDDVDDDIAEDVDDDDDDDDDSEEEIESEESCDSDDNEHNVENKNGKTSDVDGDVEMKEENSKEGSMTRIDYSDKNKTVKPIKTIIIRKRYSSDNVFEHTVKFARRDKHKNQQNHIKAKIKIQDKEAANKIKISDQLIKKLEDNTNDETVNTKISNKESEDVKETDKMTETILLEDDDKSELVQEISTDETSKSSPEKSDNHDTKKRKVTEINDKALDKSDSDIFPPNKMVKLVPIENILQRKDDTDVEYSSLQSQIIEKRQAVLKDSCENKDDSKNIEDSDDKNTNETIKIKSEINSDDDNNDDVQYMEAKRQYLSALNISEKQKIPQKPKIHEIRTRSKTEEKKSKNSDNMISKINEDISATTNNNAINNKSCDSSIVTNNNNNNNKSNDLKTPTNNSSSSTNTPNNNSGGVKEIYIKSLSKLQNPKHKARKSFPTPNYSSKKPLIARKIVPRPETTSEERKFVKATTLQPLASSPGNVMILPKLHYNKPIAVARELSSPPVLTMLPRPTLEVANNNKAPQSDEVAEQPPTATVKSVTMTSSGILLNNLLNSGSVAVGPPVIDLVDNQLDSELGVLKEILPENVAKGVGEILCQPPPKLKPKPVGLLNSVVENGGVPSTAGPVASKVHSMAEKLSDCFRGLLVETINDLGKSDNAEATISSLRLEIEELNHRHSIELAEIRRNVSIVLKDIQKSVAEERERIINETKANCEIEMVKKVEEAKSKQWCANCSKEAQFYCCWNTSYCDYPCQQKHWLKHMSKCTQTANQSPTTSTPVRTPGQPIVLTPTSAPKFGNIFTKPQKVYLKRSSAQFKQPPSGHITLVESTPGNYEFLGAGPITVNGKILASTSVIEKIKSGNIVTVQAPSASNNTQLTSANQKVMIAPKSLNRATNNNSAESSDH